MFYRRIIVLVCSSHCHMHITLLMIKSSTDYFKDEITPWLKTNGRFKVARDVVLNHVTDKVKPQYKLSSNVFIGYDGYDTLINISSYPTLI